MNYSKPSAEMIEALQALLPGRVYTGDDINDDYTHDEMAYNGKYYPDLAVEVLTTPRCADSVMKIMCQSSPGAREPACREAAYLLQAALSSICPK